LSYSLVHSFSTDTPTPELYTLSLHDALPIADLAAGIHRVPHHQLHQLQGLLPRLTVVCLPLGDLAPVPRLGSGQGLGREVDQFSEQVVGWGLADHRPELDRILPALQVWLQI